MAISFEVNATKRDELGKGASRRLRRAGNVPGIIYGGGKEPQGITLEHNELIQHLNHESFYSHILTIKVDGVAEKAVLRDVQRHPFKPAATHVDFQRVADDDVIKMHVPLHFLNEETAPGVKQSGGRVMHNLIEVEVSCKAKDLPEYIEVDLANVQLNQTLHLSDLKLPEGVQLTQLLHGTEHDLPVVTIEGPRGGEAEEAAA